MKELLNKLNDKQKEAVLYMGGPLLVLAGAGSGKTRVLTYKIAYMLKEEFFKPYEILAITFTNKAAAEMKQRVIDLIGDEAKDIWLGTFHSICVKILKREISVLGFNTDFNIIDEIDKTKIIKEIAKRLEIDVEKTPIKAVQSHISKAKDNLISAEEFEIKNSSDFFEEKVAKIYTEYQKEMKKNNSLDFDDLIYYTVKLFRENKNILEKYQNKFKYLLVDEYQDTNYSQFVLIDLLTKKYNNITVVGDESQSIYGFRGADITNILNFEKTYKNAKIIKLEQNYRSTKTILNVANSVIKNNTSKIDKSLWTENDEGESVEFYVAKNEYDEAEHIVDEIDTLCRKNSYTYSDFAVLYRTNAQSRVLEEMFIRQSTPYKLIGGTKFYQRKEIKDLTSYLKLINNPKDNVSFARIINEPKRGIGDTSVKKIIADADSVGLSAFEYISDERNIIEYRGRDKIKEFVLLINSLISIKDEITVNELMERCIEYSGYKVALETENTLESKSRLENIFEYIGSAKEFVNDMADNSLKDFLDSIALVSDVDDLTDEGDAQVTLMTIHSAKGLEFKVVFVVGLEEGLFPSKMSLDEDMVEEERRLCYVAFTRAKKQLNLSYAKQRTLYGSTTYTIISRFANEIDKTCISEHSLESMSNQNKKTNETYIDKEYDYANNYEDRYKVTDNKYSYYSTNEAAGQYNTASSHNKNSGNNYGVSAKDFLKSYGGINVTSIKDLSKSQNADVTVTFEAGQKVKHKKYGIGIITKITNEEEIVIAEVEFEKFGMKRLIATSTTLEII